MDEVNLESTERSNPKAAIRLAAGLSWLALGVVLILKHQVFGAMLYLAGCIILLQVLLVRERSKAVRQALIDGAWWCAILPGISMLQLFFKDSSVVLSLSTLLLAASMVRLIVALKKRTI